MNKSRILRNSISALLAAGALCFGAAKSHAAPANNVCQATSSSWTQQVQCRGGQTTAQGITDQNTNQPTVVMMITTSATGVNAGAVGLGSAGNVVCSTGSVAIPGNTGKSFRGEKCTGGTHVVLQHFYN